VGYSWIDSLKTHAEVQVSDEMFAAAAHRFPHNPPQSKEAYFYRCIFEKHFPHGCAAAQVPGGPSVACSTAAAVYWDPAWENNYDPSGRAVSDVHQAAFLKKPAAAAE
jgi:asparagine synthase (glutamine-hydrolysing)